MSDRNEQIILATRPHGRVATSHFRLVEGQLPQPREGQVLVRNLWLSLDPYMRWRMNEGHNYAEPVELGAVMVGATVGEVVTSHHPAFHPGDHVIGNLGWQSYGVAAAAELRKIEHRVLPLQAYLGVVGMPGITAWIGLMDILAARAGETLLVTAAAGAVGSVVGQLAKLNGCRVVGVAGGSTKCLYVENELQFDACLDYRSARLEDELADTLPDGIDCLFENVGGPLFDQMLHCMRDFGRVALCGMVADADAQAPHALRNLRAVLVKRLHLKGFIVTDHPQRWRVAQNELVKLVAEGRIKYRETVAHGLAEAPAAFVGMLAGQNFGKQLVKLC
ncbi:MAG: NADP-dependent oxidoreductase [Rhodocyclaceae bacterium]|nr:NADP-dependent oxidoreductase [Rhodocyclaceae bacterium]MBX3667570.1 NADP-dependent oxidoreductase [Rhodocyclaceae bacterium]